MKTGNRPPAGCIGSNTSCIIHASCSCTGVVFAELGDWQTITRQALCIQPVELRHLAAIRQRQDSGQAMGLVQEEALHHDASDNMVHTSDAISTE